MVVVDKFVEFFLFLVDMGLDVGEFVVSVLLDTPLEFGQNLVGLRALHRRRLELFPQGDELHFLLAVSADLAQKYLRFVTVVLLNVHSLFPYLQFFR